MFIIFFIFILGWEEREGEGWKEIEEMLKKLEFGEKRQVTAIGWLITISFSNNQNNTNNCRNKNNNSVSIITNVTRVSNRGIVNAIRMFFSNNHHHNTGHHNNVGQHIPYRNEHNNRINKCTNRM